MRQTSPGVTEFLVWAHETPYVAQDANKMTFEHMNPDLWNAKTKQDVRALYGKIPGYYCFEGLDCSENIQLGKLSAALAAEVNVEYLILSYDQAKPDQLTVRLEMVDPRFPTISTTYQSQ